MYQLEHENPELDESMKYFGEYKISLIRDMLNNSPEIPTNKGMRRVLQFNDIIFTQCKRCNGTGIDLQAHNSRCSCSRGWVVDNKLKIF